MSSFSYLHGFRGNPLRKAFSQHPRIGKATGSHFTLFRHEDETGFICPEKNKFIARVTGLGAPLKIARIVRHDEGVTEEDIKAWMEDGSSSRNMKAIYTAEGHLLESSVLDPQSKEGRFRENLANRQRYRY